MCILFNIYIGMYKTAIVSLTKEIFMIKHSVILLLVMLVVASCTNKRTANEIVEQRRSSVAGLTEYPTDSVHEEWQVGDTVQLRTEPFEL